MTHTKHRVYCQSCHRPKMLFETREKADNFIRFNSPDMLAEGGTAPVRSYYCRICCGWHVTSNPSVEEGEALDLRDEARVRLLEDEIVRKEEDRSFGLAVAPRFLEAIELAKRLMYPGRLDEAEKVLSDTLAELRPLCREHPLWTKGTKLEERAEACLGLIGRARSTFDDPEAERAVLGYAPQTKLQTLFREMVTCHASVREAEELFIEAEVLLGRRKAAEAAETARRIRVLVDRTWKKGARSPQRELEERLASLQRRIERQLERESEAVGDIETIKLWMAAGRTREAEKMLEGVIEDLGARYAGKPGWVKGYELKKRAESLLGQIARFKETFGNPEAEKDALEKRPETPEDVLFQRMLSLRIALRVIEGLFTEAEGLMEQGRWEEAREKASEIRQRIGLLHGRRMQALRARLKERLGFLEQAIKDPPPVEEKGSGPEKDPRGGHRTDRAGKPGQEGRERDPVQELHQRVPGPSRPGGRVRGEGRGDVHDPGPGRPGGRRGRSPGRVRKIGETGAGLDLRQPLRRASRKAAVLRRPV